MPKRASALLLRAVTCADPTYPSPHEAVSSNTKLIAALIREGQRLATQTPVQSTPSDPQRGELQVNPA